MKEISPKIKKYLVLSLFVIAAILSAILTTKVIINYNISDYLDDSTETKISLKIIEKEFGETCDVQVMIEDIDIDTAKDVKSKLKNVSNVLNVNFDEYDENYYKNNTALFIVLIDGDEYSSVANKVVDDIKAELDETFDGKINYGGTVIEKSKMRDAITSEMVYIIAISVALVAAIMLLTSKSWLEPVVLLLTSGIAIIINLGTNVIFGEISYITNSVVAILQLALSIDYSIVLLHSYRKAKETEPDINIAMKNAIKSVVKPVSASALTTIAGLLALLFMTFKIGFDMGVVLIKGIVISGITSLTLLPSVLLIFDKALTKTKKKDIVLHGRGFCNLSFKASKFIVPLAIVIIVVCGLLHTGNSYSFTDTALSNKNIKDTFGENNSIVVVYKKGTNDEANEAELIKKIEAYKKANGESVLKNYTAYTNTVKELYDIEKAAKKLDISTSDMELLFTMYNLYNNNNMVKLNPTKFVEYANDLITNDSDAVDFVDDEVNKTIKTLLVVEEILNNEHTADEFYNLATTGVMSGTDLDLFSVKQMYGLYYYDQISEKEVNFETMLDFILAASQNPSVSSMFDEKTVSDLTALSSGIKEFKTKMELPLTKTEFQGYMYQNYQTVIDDETAEQIYTGYYYSLGETPKETIPFLKLMTFLVAQNKIIDPTAVQTIYAYNSLYETISGKYGYEQFLPILSQVAMALTNETPTITTNEYAIQQMYIMYFYNLNMIPTNSILGKTFVDFIKETYPNNPVVNAQLSIDSKNKLDDMEIVHNFMQDSHEYNYVEMTKLVETLQNNVKSFTSTVHLNSDKISGVYIKNAVKNNILPVKSIMAYQLVDFVYNNMDTNELLEKKMDTEKKDKVLETKDDIQKAEDLFIGDKYSRMLISVDLPDESDETMDFIDYLIDTTKEVFGDDAHIAGETVSTTELKETFKKDNVLISVFTIVAVFVIVMIIFKSLSLPIILVIIIQGSIWIAMSTSLITGPIFFMSYIVATCILMGATIDYGILMSTNYVAYRQTYDRKESLFRSVEAAMPTVFTSGLILIICGFVIGFVASQTSISTVGFLLGKGTLVSAIMITVVLPSVLYLLDSFILKLSLKKKKANN